MRNLVQCITGFEGLVYTMDDPGVVIENDMLYIAERGYLKIKIPFNVEGKIHVPLSNITRVLRSRKSDMKLSQGKLQLLMEDPRMKREMTVAITRPEKVPELYPAFLPASKEEPLDLKLLESMGDIDEIVKAIPPSSRDTFCGVSQVDGITYLVVGNMKHAWIKQMDKKYPYQSFGIQAGLMSSLVDDSCSVRTGKYKNTTGEEVNVVVAVSEKQSYTAAFELPRMHVPPNKVIQVYEKAQGITDCATLMVEAEVLARAINETVSHSKQTLSTEIVLHVKDNKLRLTSGSTLSRSSVEIDCKSPENFSVTIESPEKRALSKLGGVYGDFEVTLKILKSSKIILLNNPFVSYMTMYSSMEMD